MWSVAGDRQLHTKTAKGMLLLVDGPGCSPLSGESGMYRSWYCLKLLFNVMEGFYLDVGMWKQWPSRVFCRMPSAIELFSQ